MWWSITASVAISQVISGGIAVAGGVVYTVPTVVLNIPDTSPLPNCTIGTNFSYTFNVTGGVQPYTWSLFSGSLQPGLSLSAAGVLSGQCANNSGTVTFTLQVADSAGNTTTKQFQQTAQNTPPPTLTVLTTSLPQVVQQSYYGQTLNASGGTPAYTWSITAGALPPGLTLTAGTGFITGFPSTVGTFNFTVQVTDSLAATASQALSIQVLAQGSAATVAQEPINWVNSSQGGCSSHSVACSHPNLPALCNAANLCIHEQLGFGTNDHPATLAGLTAAGQDWIAAATNWYLWVEIAAGAREHGSTFDVNSALHSGPIKATPGTGYFVATGQCDSLHTNVPCTALQARPPCYRDFSDAGIVNNPLCTNDLPSMWSIIADTVETINGVGGNTLLYMGGSNVVYNDVEVTIAPGANQDAVNQVCQVGQVCADSVIGVKLNCSHCGLRKWFGHGWDPGDPGQPTGIYPASPNGHHPCPSVAFYSTFPPSLSNLPVNAPSPYLDGCGDAIQTMVKIACIDCWLEDFTINKIHRSNNESHAIGDCSGIDGVGNGPYKLVNGVVFGGSQAIICGGNIIDPVAGEAKDMEIRKIRFTVDPGWRVLSAGAGHSPGPPARGCNNNDDGNLCPFHWALKKDVEFKYCERCLLDGVIVSIMYPDGQTGEQFVADPRVCSGGSDCGIYDGSNVPVISTNNIRMTNCIMRDASGGWGMSARSGQPGDGGGESKGAQYHLLRNCLMYNFDQVQFGGQNGGNAINYGAGTAIQFTGKATRHSGVATLVLDIPLINPKPFSHIDIGQNASSGTMKIGLNGQREDPYDGSSVTVGCDKGGTTCEGTGAGGLEFTQLLLHGADCTTLPCTLNTAGVYRPICGGGIGDSDGFLVGSACTNCGVSGNLPCPPIGCGDLACSTGVHLADATICDKTGKIITNTPPECGPANASFATWAFAVHDISPGDILHVFGCTDNSFNTPGQPQLTQVLADPSTNPGSLQITWAQLGLPDVLAAAKVTCQTGNQPGWQSDFIVQHVTLVTGGKARLWVKSGGINSQMRRTQHTDNLFYFGAAGAGSVCNGAAGEGTAGFFKCFDASTLQFHHNALIARGAGASSYSAVGLSGSVICGSGITPGNCQVPAVKCNGATVTSTSGVPDCAGFSGYMSGISFPADDCQLFDISACPLMSPPWGTFDYHKLALCGTPGATACAGGNPMATMASDGTMLGADIVKIDNAFTRPLYQCEGPCGPGPYPD